MGGDLISLALSVYEDGRELYMATRYVSISTSVGC